MRATRHGLSFAAVADALRMEALSLARGEKANHPAGSLRANAQLLLLKGDVAAIREIADRLDGRVPQAIVGDDESDPIRHRYVIEAPPLLSNEEWEREYGMGETIQ